MNEPPVSMLKPKMRTLAVLALCAVGFGGASAQPAPLYPYELQPGQSYAVEVAPHTYVIHRPAPARDYPYVRCVSGCGRPAAHSAHVPHAPQHNDPALIDELRERSAKNASKHSGKIKREVVNTTKVVRDPPVVIEHRRVVDDPPRVIERHHYVEDAPAPRRRKAQIEERGIIALDPKTHGGDANDKRVIHAEAEVTILGPDRMSIRLFRKSGADANARMIEKR